MGNPNSREAIREMAERRPERTTHMIVMLDSFSMEAYPVYVSDEENVEVMIRVKQESFQGGLRDRVKEVYSFTGKHSLEDQLDAPISYRLD